MLKQVATPAGGMVTTLGGVLTLFLGTSVLVNELRHSLNVVWRVQEPSSTEAGIVARETDPPRSDEVARGASDSGPPVMPEREDLEVQSRARSSC